MIKLLPVLNRQLLFYLEVPYLRLKSVNENFLSAFAIENLSIIL